MQSLVLAAVLSLAAARPQLPAGDRHHNYDHIYSKEGVRCQRTQNNFFFFSKQLTVCPKDPMQFSATADDQETENLPQV